MSPDAPMAFPGERLQAEHAAGRQRRRGLQGRCPRGRRALSTQVQTISLETHGGICEWEGDKLTVWISTQGVNASREGLGGILGIPQANVRVVTDYMGGGFGSKFSGDIQAAIAARPAQSAKAPVKIMCDRKAEHLVTGNRPSAFAKVRAGVDDQVDIRLLGRLDGPIVGEFIARQLRRQESVDGRIVFKGANHGVCGSARPAVATGLRE